MKKIYLLTLIPIAALLCGCNKGNEPVEPDVDKEIEELVKYDGTITIDFGNDAADPTITGTVANVNLVKHGAYVIATATGDEVVKYVLQGTTTKGGFKIYSNSRFAIYMNNASVSNIDSCAINSQSSKRMYLVLPEGTSNIACDGAGYPATKEEPNSGGEDKKGAIFSEGQIIVSGTGEIKIKGNNKHAFATDEYLRVRSGNINILGAPSDGIHAKDYLWFENGTIDIKCDKDGVQVSKGFAKLSGGTLKIDTGDDGIVCDYGDVPEDTDPDIDASAYFEGTNTTISALSGKGIYAHSSIFFEAGLTKVTCKYLVKCASVAEGGKIVTSEGTTDFSGN